MRMKSSSVAVALFGSLALATPSCRQVSFTVTAGAQNSVFGNPPDPNNATDIEEFFHLSLAQGPDIIGTQLVEGTFTIVGRYCKPPSNVKAKKTLQFLVHGITFNKSLWSGLGLADIYDWELFATSRGYHTLAIDRLGHGENHEFPSPLDVVQGPLHVEVMHAIIQIVRAGGQASPIRKFKRVVFAGHSYGSSLGNHLSLEYPDDIDAYVLTGYSTAVAIPAAVVTDYHPAATLFTRFAGLPLGYLALASESVRTSIFYDGAYDPTVPPHDFDVEDYVALGELLAPGLDTVVTPYTGHVLVVTGELDAIFCEAGPATCDQVVSDTVTLYPDADFDYAVIANSSHMWTMEYAAPDGFDLIHDWLDSVV